MVADLSFDGPEGDNAEAAILLGSVTAALLASVLVRRRGRAHAHA